MVTLFDTFENYIIKTINNNSIQYVNSFIKKNIVDKMTCRKFITINGSLASGKTYTLEALIDGIKNVVDGDKKRKIYLKRVENIDVYDEKKVFDDIIIFSKSVVGKRNVKMLAIDDYDCFSITFKSKLEYLMTSNDSLTTCIVVGERFNGWENIDTTLINTIDPTYGEILLHNKCDLPRERVIINSLLKRFIINNNIRKILYTISILKFMNFRIPEQHLYFYNNTIEYLDIEDKMNSYLGCDNRLYAMLKQKYDNNENIRDVILLIETIVYDRIDVYKKHKLYTLLEICSTIKLKIVSLKKNDKYVNYKLMFLYFMMLIRKL